MRNSFLFHSSCKYSVIHSQIWLNECFFLLQICFVQVFSTVLIVLLLKSQIHKMQNCQHEEILPSMPVNLTIFIWQVVEQCKSTLQHTDCPYVIIKRHVIFSSETHSHSTLFRTYTNRTDSLRSTKHHSGFQAMAIDLPVTIAVAGRFM